MRGKEATASIGYKLARLGPDLFVVLALSFPAFAFYCAVLFRDPPMYGIDGAYYLMEVRSILTTGAMKYPDPPLSFYLFSA